MSPTPTSSRRRSPGRWLLLPPAADRRGHVVCFPHAGGGASFYRPWTRRFPADVTFSIVDYPGREERLEEPLLDDLDAVADGIAGDLLAIDAGPLQLFGHSMGSAIAFEVARRLERDRPGWLQRLVVSARPAPVACRPPQVSGLDDDALAAQIAGMGGTDIALLRDPEVRELVLPIVRSDYRMLERHRPDPAHRIDADVLVLGGEDDVTVTPDELATWAAATRGRARRRTFAGGHFYLLDAVAEVVAELATPTDAGEPLVAPERGAGATPTAGAGPDAATTEPAATPTADRGPSTTAAVVDEPSSAEPADPAEPRDPSELVAIVGMSGRFPGARNVDELWALLRDGREALGEPTDDELLAAGVAPEALADPRFIRKFGALSDVDRFDAGFFGFSAREADLLDPQHRLFLECAWEAIEDAGHDPRRTDAAIGLYAGCGVSTYLLAQVLPARGTLRSVGEFAALMAAERDFLASRASYKLDLRGPSATILSGCSTGLFAVHLAAQSVLSGEADMALAGGSTVFFPRPSGHIHQDGSIRSADGRCHAFGAEAAGTAAGEAVGVILLRRLDDAIADGDRILGVLRGSAANNDGASGKAGFTAPSVRGQRDVIREALSVAGVPPQGIDYVEAHGTGTPLGDPIEVEALAEALGDLPAGSVRLGSVKPNVGHTDTAAGVVGLIKVLLALREQELPPSINGTPANPAIAFDETPLTLCAERTPWPRVAGRPRRAGISSFSVGGTNVHLVVEEPPALPERPAAEPAERLLVLSARGPQALEDATERLAADLDSAPNRELRDVARTLDVGRARFAHRAAVVVRPGEDPAEVLRRPDRRRQARALTAPKVAFLLPGQGSQHAGMGAALLASDPVVRATVERCAEVLAPLVDGDPRDWLRSTPGDAQATAALRDTAVTQPALFVHEYALAERLIDLGVRPAALLGHSVGELVAACLAGVLTLEDALSLVAMRGRLVQQQPAGAMVAVALPPGEALSYAADGVVLAAHNAETQSVLAGSHDAIAATVEALGRAEVRHRTLETSHAFHSPLIEGAVAPLVAHAATLTLRPPAIPVLSCVTGGWLTAEQATDPGYWGRQLREPVRFADGVRALDELGPRVAIEAGPGEALRNVVAAGHIAGDEAVAVTSLGSPTAERTLGDVLADLWVRGVDVDLAAWHGDEDARRTTLPTYPFQRARHWVAPTADDLREPVRPFSPVPLAGDYAPTGAATGGADDEAAEHGAVATVPPPASDLHPRPDVGSPFVAPDGDVQRRIAAIWEELLGVAPVGVHDDLLELGGHSLLAARIAARIQDEFPVELTTGAVLTEARTVAAAAALVDERLATLVEELSPEELDRLLAETEDDA